jgi:hypothetical protein
MTARQLHDTPSFGQVIRKQLRETMFALRIPAIVGAAFAVVATFVALSDFFRGRGGVEFAPELSLIPAIAGGLLPIAIWYQERRYGAAFLWTLPVDRTRHAFAKVIAAWACLMIAVSAFVLWLLILALITKGNITGDEVLRLLPSPATATNVAIDPSLLRTVTWTPQPAFWLTPFTAATGLYVIASAIMLGLKHPFKWIIGAIAGAFLIAAAGQGLGSEAFWAKLGTIVRTVSEGRYGLDSLLSARAESLHTSIYLTTGQTSTVWKAIPAVSDWLVATLLWTGGGIAALIAALRRHRETR